MVCFMVWHARLTASTSLGTRLSTHMHARTADEVEYLWQQFLQMALTKVNETSCNSFQTDKVLELARAEPTYSKLSDKLRRATSGAVSCRLFCGGKRCKYESTAEKMNELEQAIPGLYSTWITDSILAMARPSSFLIEQYGLLKKFKQAGLNSLFNLQLSGEHPHCGPGLESSGFTYNPEDFMGEEIFFYSFGWEDFCAPDLPKLLDVVKVMCFSMSKGRVAVHCHAGLGRTGALIACYLVYQKRVTADVAIGEVRSKRPGSVQTHGQVEVVKSFEQFLKSLWAVYPSRCDMGSLTFKQHLSNQRSLLHGREYYQHMSVPKIVTLLCSQMMSLHHGNQEKVLKEVMEYCKSDPLQADQPAGPGGTRWRRTVVGSGGGGQCVVQDLEDPCNDQDCSLQTEIRRLKDHVNSCSDWKELSDVSHFTVLFQLLLDWLWELKEPFWCSEEESGECEGQSVTSSNKQLTLAMLKKIVDMFTGSSQQHLEVKLSQALIKERQSTKSLFQI